MVFTANCTPPVLRILITKEGSSSYILESKFRFRALVLKAKNRDYFQERKSINPLNPEFQQAILWWKMSPATERYTSRQKEKPKVRSRDRGKKEKERGKIEKGVTRKHYRVNGAS
jgi:hypothetical protein